MSNFLHIIITYSKANECENDESIYSCLKCGKCGRKFNNYGMMIDDGGTTVEEEDYE